MAKTGERERGGEEQQWGGADLGQRTFVQSGVKEEAHTTDGNEIVRCWDCRLRDSKAVVLVCYKPNKAYPAQVGCGFLGSKCTDPLGEAVAAPGEGERRCAPSRVETQPQQTQRASEMTCDPGEVFPCVGNNSKTQAMNEVTNSASAVKEKVKSM